MDLDWEWRYLKYIHTIYQIKFQEHLKFNKIKLQPGTVFVYLSTVAIAQETFVNKNKSAPHWHDYTYIIL